MEEEQFSVVDLYLLRKIAIDVKKYPDRYREAGKWLDDEYNEVEKYWQRREAKLKELKKPNYVALLWPESLSESDEDKQAREKEIKHLEWILKSRHIPGFTNRFRDAWKDLLEKCSDSSFLGIEDAERVCLVTWLLTDPDASKVGLGITRFEYWPWKSGDKPLYDGDDRFYESDYLLGHNCSDKVAWMKLVYTAWEKIQAEKEIQTQTETEKKVVSEKYYIELAEQIATNLEDWAMPKGETGLRYEYVGHLKPISIALEGIDELLNWLHLNRAEEGKVVQAAYDELISRAKLDDHLLESFYENDETFSEECAVNFADTLRVVVKMAEGVAVEEPTEIDGTKREDFLSEIAEKVEEIITLGVITIGDDKERIDPESARARFREQIAIFAEKYKTFCEAKKKASEQNHVDYERIKQDARYRDKTKAPEEGLIWDDDFHLFAEHIDPTPSKFKDEAVAGWIRPKEKLSPDPTSWPKYRNTVFADILKACCYTTIAIIYDSEKGRTPIRDDVWKGFSVPEKPSPTLKLTPVQQASVIMLGCIKGCYQDYDKSIIKEALCKVKEDLLDNCKLKKQAGTEVKIASGFMSVADLAKHHGVGIETLRKRLDRRRAKYPLDSEFFIESQDRGKNKPKYLYNSEMVAPIIKELKSKRTSVKRPSEKK